MMKPNKAITDAIKITVYGAGTVLVSTVTSCALAVIIERQAHRTLYRFFPHKYADVEYANGLPHLQQRSKGVHTVDNGNEQIITDTSKIEHFDETHQGNTDNLMESPSMTPLHRESEASVRKDEPFWSSGGFLWRTKNDSTATTPDSMTTTTTSTPSSQFESYTDVINKKNERLPERVSEIVHSCAMTAG